jgi:hypothetical protein
MTETLEAFRARIKAQNMRDHLFVGEGPYCDAWIEKGTTGSEEHGYITMRVGCGYPADCHPEEETR